MHSSLDAYKFLRKLIWMLKAMDLSEASMEQGSLRVDVNVSLQVVGGEHGIKCEIKNLNGLRHIKDAIDAEVKRQTDLLKANSAVEACTLSYDSDRR